VSEGKPPAASICIISEVPERGRPETMVIKSFLSSFNSPLFVPMSERLPVVPRKPTADP
jgi:hypothetical protein